MTEEFKGERPLRLHFNRGRRPVSQVAFGGNIKPVFGDASLVKLAFASEDDLAAGMQQLKAQMIMHGPADGLTVTVNKQTLKEKGLLAEDPDRDPSPRTVA